ncbi:adenosylcobinamide-phosphate synthase CbiB [Paenibacillus sp. y28]|uniref:adenosylcobinamide-phosphate synthase CbiB n=1 Tax=Paenibacillus sp. y28 TaxID=3129110 RepID=UPI0030181F77
MLLYSLPEMLLMVAAAIVVDWIAGDPRWLPHPVVWIGKWISRCEGWLRKDRASAGHPSLRPDRPAFRTQPGPARADVQRRERMRGLALALSTVLLSGLLMLGAVLAAQAIHPWLGYAVNVWFISTTIAVKGLGQAAMLVYRPLQEGRLEEAQEKVGWIVGRDTAGLNEREVSRAAIETVAENIVDAVVSPLFFAILGGAPLAMLYRAANTLDSMVGYKNENYMHFGWASARLDDVLNYIPARITGGLVVLHALFRPGLDAARSLHAVLRFAALHPSPNSGIPESAVAGAIGIELGGVNRYGNVVSDRARMGWPLRPLDKEDIRRTVGICTGVSIWIAGGCGFAWLLLQ